MNVMLTRKILLIAPFTLMFYFGGFSQKNMSGDVTNIARVTILNPGISYEMRIAKLQTLYFQGFINTSAAYKITSSLNEVLAFYFDPALTAQYRFYYNLKKREEKKLRTGMNNLNYAGAVFETFYSKVPTRPNYGIEPAKRSIFKIGAVWGMQRNYSKRLSLDLNLGAGFFFTRNTYLDYYSNPIRTVNVSLITVMGQLNMGFRLNKK